MEYRGISMAIISASLVKELRERTGAGMMECKKALLESTGNIELAIENMRKSGKTKAAKKAHRIASEGIVVIKLNKANNNMAVMLEANCETDFVARDENFKSFVDSVASYGLFAKVTDVDSLVNLPFGKGSFETIDQARQQLVVKIGENIQLRRFVLLEAKQGTIASYKHGERIGVLVHLSIDDLELGKDLAMHIAASNPQVIAPKDVSQTMIDKEKEIFLAQASESGKPSTIVEKMVAGRIEKFVNEISLLGQPFIKDPNRTVKDLLEAKNAVVFEFVRFEVGEGIDKKTKDFATEVMAQLKDE